MEMIWFGDYRPVILNPAAVWNHQRSFVLFHIYLKEQCKGLHLPTGQSQQLLTKAKIISDNFEELWDILKYSNALGAGPKSKQFSSCTLG